jgi:L-threonylcarbamoyladenylate synthase
MRLVEIDPFTPDAAIIEEAARLIRAGRLVAFPTETVYGLGANALDPLAIARIYAAKGRPSYNPLIVHIADAPAARAIVREWTETANALANRFWPGPLTLVLPKQPNVPDSVTAGLDGVAVRVPSHAVARALLIAAGVPVAAPSANRSMMLSPTTGRHVATSLGDAVDLILDAGPTTVGIESTVIDLTGDVPTLLRPGTITVPELESVIGPIAVATTATAGTARPSPGMMDRHYSPRARVVLVAARDVPAVVHREQSAGTSVGALVIDADADDAIVIRLSHDPSAYAARLYDALHALDDDGVQVIVVEALPETPAWLGVRDRLERAAR